MNFTVADDKWQSKWEIFLFFSPFYFFVGVLRFTMTVSSRKKINSSKVIHLSGTRKSFRIWQNLKKKTYLEKSVSSLKEKEKKEKVHNIILDDMLALYVTPFVDYISKSIWREQVFYF